MEARRTIDACGARRESAFAARLSRRKKCTTPQSLRWEHRRRNTRDIFAPDAMMMRDRRRIQLASRVIPKATARSVFNPASRQPPTRPTTPTCECAPMLPHSKHGLFCRDPKSQEPLEPLRARSGSRGTHIRDGSWSCGSRTCPASERSRTYADVPPRRTRGGGDYPARSQKGKPPRRLLGFALAKGHGGHAARRRSG